MIKTCKINVKKFHILPIVSHVGNTFYIIKHTPMKTYFPHQKLCHLLIDNVADILKPSRLNLTETFTGCFFAK